MIDSHHHFWNFNEEEFGWIPMDSIKRSFNTPELCEAVKGTEVTGAISVQARCSLEENDYLLEQASQSNLIKGVVGWLDLKANNLAEQAAPYLNNPLFKGIREITQGASDAEFFEHPDFNRGVSQLAELGLSYDLLIFEDQLTVANQFVQNHQDVAMVLDHCGKPNIRNVQFPTEWVNGIREIAKNPNLYCKLSGLVTEIKDGSAPTSELFQPYVDTVLEAFGPERVMLGSDWPVSLMEQSYADCIDALIGCLASLDDSEKQNITTDNASHFYRI